MSKKDAKDSEAQLPMPPTVEGFMGALEDWKGKQPDEPRGSNMFGHDSDKGMFHGILCHWGKIGGVGGSNHSLSNKVLPAAMYFCMVADHF